MPSFATLLLTCFRSVNVSLVVIFKRMAASHTVIQAPNVRAVCEVREERVEFGFVEAGLVNIMSRVFTKSSWPNIADW